MSDLEQALFGDFTTIGKLYDTCVNGEGSLIKLRTSERMTDTLEAMYQKTQIFEFGPDKDFALRLLGSAYLVTRDCKSKYRGHTR
jgi:hypothetical protein